MSVFNDSVLVRYMFWFLWGLLTKMIDLHYDDRLFRRDIVMIATIGCGLSVGLGMAAHDETFVIYAAIISACLLSGKIDNIAFSLSTVLVFGTVVFVHTLLGVHVSISGWGALAWLLLTFGYVLDEKLNDLMERNETMARSPRAVVRWTYIFLKHRCTSVVCEITVVVIGAMTLLGILQGALFNAGYYAMHMVGKTLLHKRLHAQHGTA